MDGWIFFFKKNIFLFPVERGKKNEILVNSEIHFFFPRSTEKNGFYGWIYSDFEMSKSNLIPGKKKKSMGFVVTSGHEMIPLSECVGKTLLNI